MMVIDWDGSIYRNENALKKLQAMWEAHMPFRLALPRFPTDSDAL
jgi:hypothetical protein